MDTQDTVRGRGPERRPGGLHGNGPPAHALQTVPALDPHHTRPPHSDHVPGMCAVEVAGQARLASHALQDFEHQQSW